MKRILIIEDDAAIAELERDYLEASDMEVDHCADGKSGLEAALSGKYDLILLDVMLPEMDGFQVCRAIRKESEIPVLMVTAKLEDYDKVRGIGLGADDYIVKPFSPTELVARVKGNIKRYERLLTSMAGSGQNEDNYIKADDIEILIGEHKVLRNGEELSLTNLEFDLLLYLARNQGIVFSKDQLFEKVWGLDAVGDTSTVMVHINRLREKVEVDPAKPYYIETVWGVGYRFVKK
ncbi:response regulator transcription factor [Veillonella sp. YH-vei2232]|jgi:two-component system alkaline phosphatase synthesis response regulator PhoP|uniref:Response regulator transcription factor n=1 Tax=Veillonella absiana TaxID=3079305 RepID=A0ABU3ZAX4_9FIRM|nr:MULTISPECIES: response regulator transcription factor [unclassified Veillonella]MBP9551719.1 response regulator transcription factor [Veillonella sp.]MDV5064146.1 response regulator transcription factor [Veillonella sp. YH-vei2232]MDV5089064.1 response regulator transcription factor [Veillonella sp. YH-vei2233]NCB96290.1 response regulator transcription factor [Negativicutes bacterium]